MWSAVACGISMGTPSYLAEKVQELEVARKEVIKANHVDV
jgi:hypothetical protein